VDAVAGELVELGEAALVQERSDALAGGDLSLGMLLFNRFRPMQHCTAASMRTPRFGDLRPSVVWMSISMERM
jgi:hypothetical protein